MNAQDKRTPEEIQADFDEFHRKRMQEDAEYENSVLRVPTIYYDDDSGILHVDDENVKYADFIEAFKLSAEMIPIRERPDDYDRGGRYPQDHWKVIIKREDQEMVVYFSCGVGHRGKPPELKDVLSCIASDIAGTKNVRDVGEWMYEFGIEIREYRQWEKMWENIRQQEEELGSLLEDYETDAMEILLWKMESL